MNKGEAVTLNRGQMIFEELQRVRGESGLRVNSWEEVTQADRVGYLAGAQRVAETVTAAEVQGAAFVKKVKDAQPRKEPNHNKLLERICDKVPAFEPEFDLGDDDCGEVD